MEGLTEYRKEERGGSALGAVAVLAEVDEVSQ